jgi:hypothetical protein
MTRGPLTTAVRAARDDLLGYNDDGRGHHATSAIITNPATAEDAAERAIRGALPHLPDQVISLPTRNGRIDLLPAAVSAKCATGCKTMGGGFLLASVYGPNDGHHGDIPLCGNCLAEAIVARIDALNGTRSGTRGDSEPQDDSIDTGGDAA